MSIASELAGFVTQTRCQDIPPRAIDYAAMLVSSTVASAAMGSTLESSRIVRALLARRGGAAEATVWFNGGPRLPVAAAARANALMSDAAASDDSDLRNITHPGTTLVAAAVAMAEKTGADGKDVLAAIALGYEAVGRINGAVVPGLMYEKGFHGCMVTVLGGAVAAGLLMKLDARQMTHALALAATSISGLLAAARTSTAREHHAGLAAMLGVEAAELAGLGYTGEEGIFEHPKGYFFMYGQDAHASGRVAAVTQGLGTAPWQILTHMALKLVPGAHTEHAMAEAAAEASRRAGDAGVPPGEIAAIVVSRPKAHLPASKNPPTDLIGIAHSPAYFAAAAAADRAYTWVHATPDKIMDPAIRRLLPLVEAGPPPTADVDRYQQGATVTVRAADGRSFSATVFAPRGAAVNGIEWADVEEKFTTLCPLAGMTPQAVARCAALLRGFREATGMTALVELLG